MDHLTLTRFTVSDHFVGTDHTDKGKGRIDRHFGRHGGLARPGFTL